MKSLTGFAFDVKYLTFKAQIHQIPRNLTENEPIYEIAGEIQGGIQSQSFVFVLQSL